MLKGTVRLHLIQWYMHTPLMRGVKQWQRRSVAIPAMEHSLYLAAVHIDHPENQARGLHLVVATEGVLTERYYNHKGWNTGLRVEIANGPVAAATHPDRQISIYAHDKDRPTMLREWYFKDGWHSRQVTALQSD